MVKSSGQSQEGTMKCMGRAAQNIKVKMARTGRRESVRVRRGVYGELRSCSGKMVVVRP